MIDLDGSLTQREIVARCRRLITAHLDLLAAGRDPWGHLYGIERIARATRSEWSEEQRQLDRGRGTR